MIEKKEQNGYLSNEKLRLKSEVRSLLCVLEVRPECEFSVKLGYEDVSNWSSYHFRVKCIAADAERVCE